MQVRRARGDALFAAYSSVGLASQPGGEVLRRGRTATVHQWQQGLLFSHGKFRRLLEPGRYRFWQAGCSVRVIDLRPWVLTLPVQEVPTADGATVKVTVAGHAKVADALTFVTASRDPEQSLYLAVQVALRDMMTGLSVEELLSARGGLGERLLAGVGDTGGFGVTVTELVIKDIILTGELKKAQAELLVARAQGLAALERARGETAALRSLANAARMASANPALLQLRLIQQLGTSAGHTVIIGTGPTVPVSAVTNGSAGAGDAEAGDEATS